MKTASTGMVGFADVHVCAATIMGVLCEDKH